MVEPKSYIGVLKHFDSKEDDTRNYYVCLPNLVRDDYPFEIAIAYVFIRLEQAYHQCHFPKEFLCG